MMTESERETRADLMRRIELIESMMREGRRKTEYWGWAFVLWGVAYLLAMGVSALTRMPQFVWPAVMITAFVATGVVSAKKHHAQPRTQVSRAISAIWSMTGTAIFVYTLSVAASGHAEDHSYVAAIEVFLGIAYCASGLTLRWNSQLAFGLFWWASAIATCFVPLRFVAPILVLDVVVGMLGFGTYLMVSERRVRRASGRHA